MQPYGPPHPISPHPHTLPRVLSLQLLAHTRADPGGDRRPIRAALGLCTSTTGTPTPASSHCCTGKPPWPGWKHQGGVARSTDPTQCGTQSLVEDLQPHPCLWPHLCLLASPLLCCLTPALQPQPCLVAIPLPWTLTSALQLQPCSLASSLPEPSPCPPVPSLPGSPTSDLQHHA